MMVHFLFLITICFLGRVLTADLFSGCGSFALPNGNSELCLTMKSYPWLEDCDLELSLRADNRQLVQKNMSDLFNPDLCVSNVGGCDLLCIQLNPQTGQPTVLKQCAHGAIESTAWPNFPGNFDNQAFSDIKTCSLVQQYCPNDCSQHGTCDRTRQACQCNQGWTGGDCSTVNNATVIEYGCLSMGLFAGQVCYSFGYDPEACEIRHVLELNSAEVGRSQYSLADLNEEDGLFAYPIQDCTITVTLQNQDTNSTNLDFFIALTGDCPITNEHTINPPPVNVKGIYASCLDESVCMNNCSGHGQCINEECHCDPGWIGFPDCSKRTTEICVPPRHWTCAPEAYNAGDKCDCNCGVYDPDCDIPELLIFGCPSTQVCGYHGLCSDCRNDTAQLQQHILTTVPIVSPYGHGWCSHICHPEYAGKLCQLPSSPPASWSCPLEHYGDGLYCDCQCGAIDPDCEMENVQIRNCDLGQSCSPNGQCQSCLNHNDVFQEYGEYTKSSEGLMITTDMPGECKTTCYDGLWGPLCDDHCHFEACQFAEISQMRTCFSQWNVSDAIGQDTIHNLKKMIDLYTFVDISKGPPLNVNLEESLDHLLTAGLTPWKLQEALNELFRSLNDAHTLYIKPDPFLNCYAIQPFSFMHYVEDGQQGIYIKSALLPGFENFVGTEVLQIGDSRLTQRPAVEVISNYSNKSVGFSKDAGTRFNEAVDWAFTTRNQGLYNFPNDLINRYYTSAGRLSLPWLAYSRAAYKNKEQFYYDSLSSQAKQISEFVPSDDFFYHNLKNEVSLSDAYLKEIAQLPQNQKFFSRITQKYSFADQLKDILPSKEEEPQEEPEPQLEVVFAHSGSGITLYNLENKTIIIKIASFVPTEEIESAYWSLVQGMNLAANLNISDVIIDLTDNGGGYICLAYEMMFYMALFPINTSIPPFDFTQNYIQNSLAEANARDINNSDTMWNPTYYFNQQTKENYHDASWMTGGRSLTRAGHSRMYSDLLTDYCADPGKTAPTHKFTPDRILLLSHGFCGSACNMFSSTLQETHKAQTLTYGGFKDTPQMISSFPGGQVYQLAEIINDWGALGLDPQDPQGPKPFQTTSRYTWNIREVYSLTPGKENIPMEFVLDEHSTFHMNYSPRSALSQAWLYQEAQAFFDRCVETSPSRQCRSAHGSGKLHCDQTTGRYATHCQIEACELGYQLDAQMNQCHPCPVGTYRDNTTVTCKACPNPSDSIPAGEAAAISVSQCQWHCQPSFYFDGAVCQAFVGETCPSTSPDNTSTSCPSAATPAVLGTFFGILFGALLVLLVGFVLHKTGKIQISRRSPSFQRLEEDELSSFTIGDEDM